MLLKVLKGFTGELVRFFRSYLEGWKTWYRWGEEESDKFDASIGVRQGSVLSPLLLALYLATIVNILDREIKKAAQTKDWSNTFLLYVNNGTLIGQGKTYKEISYILEHFYKRVHDLLENTGLYLKHNKMKIFHFFKCQGDENPDFTTITCYEVQVYIKPQLVWHYLGFYFD